MCLCATHPSTSDSSVVVPVRGRTVAVTSVLMNERFFHLPAATFPFSFAPPPSCVSICLLPPPSPPPVNSVVRVLIDVAFAFLYFLSGVRGWLGNSLDLSNDPISSDSWFQNLLVPLLMVAPLWWRFQQNLRRSYETRQR